MMGEEHYFSKGKPKIISLYTERTFLWKASGKSIMDYIISAENAATLLKASEVISNNLLIAMVWKGLPSEFKQFTAVISQKDKLVSEFKVASQSFEETEKMTEENKWKYCNGPWNAKAKTKATHVVNQAKKVLNE